VPLLLLLRAATHQRCLTTSSLCDAHQLTQALRVALKNGLQLADASASSPSGAAS